MIKFSKKTLAILIIVVLSPVLVPLLFLAGSALMAGIYWSFGYYVNIPGWKMGQIAAEKESVEECELLRKTWYFGGFDSGDMHRSECIHTYASLTLDPTACELLMPSEYGFSCIGAAEGAQRLCSIDYGRKVGWGSYLDDTRKEASIEDCLAGNIKDKIGKRCCHISMIANIRDFNDCSQLSEDKTFFDECIHQLALKNGDAGICKSIIDSRSRVACSLRAKYKFALSSLPKPIE